MPEFFGEIALNQFQSFNVNLLAGRTYYFELEGEPTGAGTLGNPSLSLFRSNVAVASDDDGGVGLNARLVYTPTQTLDYRIDVADLFGTTSLDSFRLRVFEDDFRSTVEGNGAAGAINTGASRTATIHYAEDEDLFTTTLISGLTYTVEARGLASNSGTLEDPLLSVLNAADEVIAVNDDRDATSLDSLLTFRATASGTHYLKGGSFGDGTGTYRMVVSEGSGTTGNNNIVGTAAQDAINGLAGNDTISGGGSADLLKGGAGADILIGGAGADTFRFLTAAESAPGLRDSLRSGDGVVAFENPGAATGDRIDLAGIDANDVASGNQTFLFGGTGLAHLTLSTSGTDTLVRGNTDADAAFEFELLIADGSTAATAYTAADFLL